jgi:hypothetical protein
VIVIAAVIVLAVLLFGGRRREGEAPCARPATLSVIGVIRRVQAEAP